ncbi:hypothetical protein MXL46_09065 [Heyndrickxia sporothermodurans]|uniref:Uncharacterized protein n=2 Tax=Heyndrickxia sporothermodurans TaxID=46224 RepID=A0AB37HL29_9BACI|nr:hypothetical protein [Heyndrickxia sporothermodurans]MBL5766871.1 hypothetical protein [Heyndrickxia sporothermodurans]MBL5776363.1 hypothetical protein [Heyndrickxia sporothermodurans]MBL5780085.1 hypothetical protein [Heyndrickxia sporothermodurans]MBL5782356.1 hypothetical protein [Heyndrickxia sporothermodurans]MBL5784721.1 hypothetical protein [Heyndrickxia sporothermodurans]
MMRWIVLVLLIFSLGVNQYLYRKSYFDPFDLQEATNRLHKLGSGKEYKV